MGHMQNIENCVSLKPYKTFYTVKEISKNFSDLLEQYVKNKTAFVDVYRNMNIDAPTSDN